LTKTFDGLYEDLNCEWCLEQSNKPKEVQAFASLVNGGCFNGSPICRNCLCAVINQEIENIRTNAYEGADKRLPMVPIEIEVIKSIAFEGLE
jgi:hypothetical protein